MRLRPFVKAMPLDRMPGQAGPTIIRNACPSWKSHAIDKGMLPVHFQKPSRIETVSGKTRGVEMSKARVSITD